MVTQFYFSLLTGRNRTGIDQAGHLIHAVAGDGEDYPDFKPALCGAKPGRLSNGWSTFRGSRATCPKCIKKLDKVTP